MFLSPERIRIFDVQRLVASQAGIRIADLLADDRSQPLAQLRQEAYWLARKLTGRSYPYLGAAFGGRDHTTVRHGVMQIDRRRRTDPEIRDRLYRLEIQLKESANELETGAPGALRQPDGVALNPSSKPV